MIVKKLKQIWAHFRTDNLFRNSIYLMMTTGIMGGFGFFFWIICTRLFTPDEIGIGTTLISSMSMISFISLLGFNSTFIRFLPSSRNRNTEINTGSLLVTLTALTISTIYVILLPHITPKLAFIHENIWYSLTFIMMVTLASINSLTDSIFVAYRSAHYSLITSGIIASLSKLILPLVFVSIGAYGIFSSSGVATAFGMIASILFLFFKFSYRPELRIDKATLKKVFRYSFTNYIATLFSMAPTLILPIIILNNLGASAAGYYYLAFMVMNLLYTVSGSVSQSLFAEGSYSENTLRILLKRSIIILTAILIPAGIVLAIFGPYVLHFFGKAYNAGGSGVIVILALGSPIVAAFNLSSTLLKIRQQVYSLVTINAIYALVICILTMLWVHKGLLWVAIAWNTGTLVATLLAFASIYYYRHLATPVLSSEN